MFRNIVVAMSLILMAACASNDDNSGGQNTGNGGNSLTLLCQSDSNQALVGCWKSEACVASTPSPGFYYQVVLDFRSDGTLVQGLSSYDNSSCSGQAVITRLPLKQNYQVSDPVATTDGVGAHYLKITFPGFSTINYAAYNMPGAALCFATGQFDVNGSGGGLTPSFSETDFATLTSVTMDYVSCLIK